VKRLFLVGLLIALFLATMVAPLAFGEPNDKVVFTFSGIAIKAPVSETHVVGDGSILIFRSQEDAIMRLVFIMGANIYYVKASVSNNIEYNTKTMQGNGLYKWTMEFHAKKLTVTVDNPVIGTLEGTTIVKLTARTPEGIATGAGMQIGSHGTGIMEGVKTESEGTYYPMTVSGELGTIVTQGVSYEGTAVFKD